MQRWTLGLAAALAIGSGACGGASTVAKAPVVDAAQEKQAAKDAKALVREIYGTLSRSSNDGLMALLAEPLVVFGPRPSDAHATRSDALVAMRTVLDERGREKKTSLGGSSLAVSAASTGLSAWAVDVVTVDGVPMAVAAVLSNEDDFWVVVAASLARLPSRGALASSLGKEAVVPTASGSALPTVGAAADAVERLERGLADPDQWVQDLRAHDEAAWLGAVSGEVARGPKAIATFAKKRAKNHVRYATAGDASAGVTRDGALAWVTVPAVRFADDDDPIPLRLFGVLERGRSGWSLVMLQESLAVDEPGAAARFKKISPPAIHVDEPAAPAPGKAKKKKSRKTSPRDDS